MSLECVLAVASQSGVLRVGLEEAEACVALVNFPFCQLWKGAFLKRV